MHRFQQKVDFVQSTQSCRCVTIGDFDKVIDDVDEIPFEERIWTKRIRSFGSMPQGEPAHPL